MSRIKSIISTVVAVLVFLHGGHGFVNRVQYENSNNDINQDAYVTYYNKLIRSFGVDEYGETMYDDYFAGGAFTKEGFVVFVKDGNEEAIAEYRSYAGENEILFEAVDYSLSELIKIQGDILAHLNSPETIVCSISCSQNKVILRCEKDDQLFNEYIVQNELMDCVVVHVGSIQIEFTSLHGGDSSSTAGSTIGWCGTYNNSPAILTCAHGNCAYNSISVYMEDTNSSITANKAISCYDCLPAPGTYTGMITPEPVGDYYIATVSSGLTTNDFHGGTNGSLVDCSSYVPTLPEQTTIHMYGNASGGHTAVTQESNTVVRRSFWVGPVGVGDPYVFWGLILASFSDTQTQEGDSGGPVWYHFTSSGTNAATGTISAIITNGSEACFAYSPIKYAVAQGFSVRTW